MRNLLAAVGLVVVSFAVVGFVKTGGGVANGTDSPGNLSRNITEEYQEAGFLPPASNGDRRPASRRDTPSMEDHDRALQEIARQR